jgi:hypothetical protein
MGASDSGQGIIEGVIGKAAVLTTLVDQAEDILFELVDCIPGKSMCLGCGMTWGDSEEG